MREIKHALTSEPKRVNAGELILKFLATLVLFKFTRLAGNETTKMRVTETLRIYRE